MLRFSLSTPPHGRLQFNANSQPSAGCAAFILILMFWMVILAMIVMLEWKKRSLTLNKIGQKNQTKLSLLRHRQVRNLTML